MYFGVTASHISPVDLDRHPYSQIFKMVAVKTIISISCEFYLLERPYLYQYEYVDKVFDLMKLFAFDLD